MDTAEKPRVLPWNLEVWGGSGPESRAPGDVEHYAAATRLAVVGTVDDSAYLYVVEKDPTRLVTVLAVVDVGAAGLKRDADTRVPGAGVWLWMPNGGVPFVVGSAVQLDRDRIAETLGGHSPPPSPTTIGTSKTGASP